MSIRIKLLLSNILMLAIPFVSSMVLAVILIGTGFERVDIDPHKPGFTFNRMAKDMLREFVAITNDALNNPDMLKDKKYLQDFENKLKPLNSGLALVIENEVYFLTEKMDMVEFEKFHAKVEKTRNTDRRVMDLHKEGVEYFYHNFRLSDGKNSTLYIFVDISPISKFFRRFVSEFTFYFVLIVLLTNGLLTFFVSQSIIKPLKKLKFGAEQIKDGNLAFVIDEKSKDEVGEVCRAFEEMRQRLKEAIVKQLKYDEERNEFIASITHDLKTPITSIKGHIEGLKDGVADTQEKKEKYIDIMYKKITDMDRLINDLTFYSNQTLNKVPFNFSRVNLKIFIEDIIDEYQLELEKMGILIESSYNLEPNVMIKADVEKFKRVVANIIDNSIKYMNKEKGIIRIDVNDRNNKIVIGIHDNGNGIKKEFLPYIFDMFYRADPSRNSSISGSGLGLAIAKQIINEHGGQIWAESEPGKGTSIYIELEKKGEKNEKADFNN
ncbi:MAG: ATP-binding protein [Bacillota bacterium]